MLCDYFFFNFVKNKLYIYRKKIRLDMNRLVFK